VNNVDRNLLKTCLNCNSSLKSRRVNFCKPPSYCRYEYQLKQRDLKAYNILSNKDSNFYYLIGLICTDGTLRYPKDDKLKNIGYSFSISVNINDIETINSLQNLFGGKTTTRKDNTANWYISNKKFVEYLLNVVGLTSNKTYSLNVSKWFESLEQEFKIDFLRGVIDGDGSIKIFNKHFRTFNICTASESFKDMIVSFLTTYYSDNVKVEKNKSRNYYYIRYNGRYMIDFLNDIYNNLSKKIYLKRKYNTFIEIKNFFNTYGKK
jgi:hypothetical protein